MSDSYFQMKDLSVGYHGNVLIHDICTEIKKGEILTLIGPNGSGKSTILKSITKQLTLIGGKVTIGEKNLKDLSYKELATQMAVVLTQRAKPELMTCYEVVAAGRYPYTGRLGILTREDEKKTQEALEIVHATEYAEKSFEAISDGQRQRILLARAICQEPEVLILDEPTSFLDIRYKLELLTILKNMAKEKQITVIMSLHEIDLAQKISDKILCVKGDTIFGYGEPEAIFKEDFIQKLYEIDNGHFDPLFGSVELAKAEGEAEVFVISSGGSGIPVYRNLQKAKIPFSAGILYTNDIDYHLAKHLAVNVIEEEPFEPVSDRAFERAKQMIRQCKKVINADQIPEIEVLHLEKSYGFFKTFSEKEQEEVREMYGRLWNTIQRKISTGDYDMLVIDEFMAAYRYGLIPNEEAVQFLKDRPDNLEVVLTGRDPSDELLELADYISEVKMVRHPFEKGIRARKGIEY